MIVEDDPTVLTVVGDYLRAAGYPVAQFADGDAARIALSADVPDVLVLDRMLPGVSGDELCREVRASAPQVAIIMLTALDSVDERINGLEYGADDYVAKPFALRELQLRIDATIRRARGATTSVSPFAVGPFRVDPARRRIWLDDHEISLTTREYELFLFFLQNPERIHSRDEILREVWGWSFGEASTVTVHVRRLREKIEPEPRFPRHLLTEWGAGYRFTVQESE
ncbi:response regulator transcription factor [Gordonia insulae]|uniref:Alkaline phosphatase synthesis transcriptional regulatory protein SphR n=1 Tax=Gordonia insulae TaxID=2420509 RepID=A0A3G8JQY4_9ACTN|nr:response regulator transcription factor [Gordonia insulae]AZG47554.1 Alkaline phosphatase synthesis transcriptional regulatory protein SphR [Gordonia insulae]